MRRRDSPAGQHLERSPVEDEVVRPLAVQVPALDDDQGRPKGMNPPSPPGRSV
jgi:hypothetical protein